MSHWQGDTTRTYQWTFGGCSLYRTQLPGWSQERDDENTSRQCYVSCTGFQCGSNWPVSRRPIWSRPSVLGGWCPASCWLTADGVSFDQSTTEHASFLGLRTETFLLPDCDTRYQLWTISKHAEILSFEVLVSHGASWPFEYCALEALLLTYLLTYLFTYCMVWTLNK